MSPRTRSPGRGGPVHPAVSSRPLPSEEQPPQVRQIAQLRRQLDQGEVAQVQGGLSPGDTASRRTDAPAAAGRGYRRRWFGLPLAKAGGRNVLVSRSAAT